MFALSIEVVRSNQFQLEVIIKAVEYVVPENVPVKAGVTVVSILFL